MKGGLTRLLGQWRRSAPPPHLRMVIVHVGKTVGTALASALAADRAQCGIERARVLGHSETLSRAAHSYPGREIGFCLRDPVDRFISGFYSRQRRGRPRYDNAWTPAEAEAFGRFATPDALGRALAADDLAAHRAMEGVLHLRRGLAHYLEGIAVLERHAPRIGFIGRQETLAADVAWLRRRLGLSAAAALPDDDIGAHRNPAKVEKVLSEGARAALEEWYAPDYAVQDWCLRHRRDLGLG